MIRKLFIVASGNTSAYRSLQNSVGLESDVAIIYDRRSRSDNQPIAERRQETDIDRQIATDGWAVVHNQAAEPIRQLELATNRYNTLRSIWSGSNENEP
jgi:hypothetical protein